MVKDNPIPWKPGDPVGVGEVYLPDKKTREAYGRACREQWLEAAAVAVMAKRMLQERRYLINAYPVQHREALKAKVAELWERLK